MTGNRRSRKKRARKKVQVQGTGPGNHTPPAIIDLFCGAGGMSLGFGLAGFSTLAAFDNFGPALESFRHSHPNTTLHTDDIRNYPDDFFASIARESLVSGVIGGPPCQGFSLAGFRDRSDNRNSLVWHFFRIVRAIRPVFFVMENVVGFTSMRDEEGNRFVDALRLAYERMGYQTNAAILDACDYGTPQRRRRFFLVGTLARRFSFPLPTHGRGLFGLPPVAAGEAILDLPSPTDEEPQTYSYRGVLSSFLHYVREGNPEIYNHVPSKHKDFMIERMRKQPVGKPLYDNFSHAWFRLDPMQPAPTVKENHNAPFVHPVEPRVTTPRECARLQGFPDWYRFFGPKSSQLVQVGNAVPPLLAKSIGVAIREQVLGMATLPEAEVAREVAIETK